jgi:hypothetical protein
MMRIADCLMFRHECLICDYDEMSDEKPVD